MDLYHAREHLHDLGKLLAFMLGDQHDGWLAERSGELDDGDIPALLSAARAFPLTAPSRNWTPPWATSRPTPPGALQALPLLRPVRRLRRRGSAARRSSGNASNSPAALVPARATGILTLRCQKASGRWKKSGNAATTHQQPEPLRSPQPTPRQARYRQSPTSRPTPEEIRYPFRDGGICHNCLPFQENRAAFPAGNSALGIGDA